MRKLVTMFCVLGTLSTVGVVFGQSRAAQTKQTDTSTDTADKKKCPEFTELLYWGVSDKEVNGQVKQLQQWLLNYPALYPSGKVDGVFNEDLELAVRRLQKKYSLVTPGLSCKTGYGLVEDKTRKYLNEHLSCEPFKPRALLRCNGVQCPNITQNLAQGAFDPEGVLGEVGTLQCFLAGQGLLSPQLVTGAFGPSTVRALISYQAKNGIAQTGSVNNQTRANIAKCGKSTAGAQSRGQKYSFYIKPASGDAPLQISLSFALNGTSCSSYSVDWGDGSAPLAYDAGRPASCVQQPVTLFEKHTYTKSGSYTVTLKHGQDTLGRIPVVNQAQITVR